MKTMTVTHGEWVSYRSSLVLQDDEFEALRAALESDNARERRDAQQTLLERLQFEPAQLRQMVARSEAALEAIDFDLPVRLRDAA